MCARTAGTLPKPRLHNRGYLRIRVGGRDFTLGKPGTRQADERYKAENTLVAISTSDGARRVCGDRQRDVVRYLAGGVCSVTVVRVCC